MFSYPLVFNTIPSSPPPSDDIGCLSARHNYDGSPTFSDDPPLSPQRVPEAVSLTIPPPTIPTIDHKIFAVYHRESAATLIPDSGATHILIRETDADILHSTTPYPPHTRRPQFEVANRQFISPIATGVLQFPESTVTTQAYVFRDTDLADNLFGIAPLLHQGYTATFTDSAFTIHSPHHVLLYGSKAPHSNTWRFSLPKPTQCRASAVIRHEQHAEMVLFAYATFGSPAYSTFYNAVRRGWLSNYPNLTPEMVRRNKPHVPAYALGHIQASRSGICSTRHALDTTTTATDPIATESRIEAPPALYWEIIYVL